MIVNTFKKNKDLVCLIFGFTVLFLFLYPYWLWGNLSALGWYDESIVVPWYFSKSILFNNADGFMHGYVGGSRSAFVCVSDNEKFSLYRFLITHYDLWVAGILFRLGGFFLLFSGVYTFIRRVLQHKNSFLAMSISLSTVLVDYIPYGWTVGGIGWDYGIIAWLCVIFFTSSFSLKLYLFTICLSLIASITCMPIFLIPSSFYMFIFAVVVIHGFPIKRQEIFKWSIVWFIFLTLMALNWHEAMNLALVQTKEFSSRILDILSPRTVFSPGDSLINKLFSLAEYNLKVFYGFLTRKPHHLLIFIYMIVFLLAWEKKLYQKTFIFVIFAFLFPPCIDIFSKISGIDYLSKFSWTSLWDLQSMMLSFFIVYLLSFKGSNVKKI